MEAGNAKMRTEIRKAIFGDYDKINLPDNPNVKFGLTLLNLDVVSSIYNCVKCSQQGKNVCTSYQNFSLHFRMRSKAQLKLMFG